MYFMDNFAVNDLVIHLREGVARVISIVELGNVQYFLVKSERNQEENIYVPVNRAEFTIRHLLSSEQATELLKSLHCIQKEFNSNTKQRRDAFKRRLSSGLVEDMAYLYRQYYLYQKDPEGVKLGQADIDMLEYATNYILDELAIVFNVNRQQIANYILTIIG